MCLSTLMRQVRNVAKRPKNWFIVVFDKVERANVTEGKIKARILAKSTVPVQHFVLSAPHSSKSSDSILMWYTLAIDMKMLPWMSLSISCRWTVAPNCGNRMK